jgi:hypothetical protein
MGIGQSIMICAAVLLRTLAIITVGLTVKFGLENGAIILSVRLSVLCVNGREQSD